MVVPKAWVERSGIRERNNVDMYEDDSGNIVISSKGTAPKESELLVGAGLNPEVLGRWVVMYYRQGTKRLRVYSREGSASKQFENAERIAMQRCPGFEVISRSNKEMVFEDFTDIRELSADKLLLRLRSLVSEELEEIGKVSPSEIGKLEELVDRFFSLGIRYINIVRGRGTTNYFKMFQLLESTADMIYILAKRGTMNKNTRVPETLKKELETCFKGLSGDYRAIELSVEMKNSIIKAARKDGLPDFEAYLIEEIVKNMVKIAELGLEVPQQELAIK